MAVPPEAEKDGGQKPQMAQVCRFVNYDHPLPHLPPMTIQYFEYLKSWSIGLDHFIWANGGDPNTKAVAESLLCTFGMPKNTKAETKDTQ